MSQLDNILSINLNAIARNYKFIKEQLSKPTKCAAVVKANAYGLGASVIVRHLSSVGCNNFFVATVDEARELRSFTMTDNVYVLNGIAEGQEEDFMQQSIVPVLNDIHQLKLWNQYAMRKDTKLSAIIHIDTGMNRLGISFEDAIDILKNKELTKNIKIKYLMSHLACAETSDHPLNKKQLERCKKIKAEFPDIPFSLCNSSGVFLGPEYHFDMVRSGAMLYGFNPSDRDRELNTVVTLTSKIIQVRKVTKKCTVGYSATKDIKPGTILATIPIGYADGYPWNSSNKGFYFVDDIKVPIVGRVSMDLTVLDVSEASEDEVKIGSEVEVIGDDYTVKDVARDAGTSGYEIMTTLSYRYKKVYLK